MEKVAAVDSRAPEEEEEENEEEMEADIEARLEGVRDNNHLP